MLGTALRRCVGAEEMECDSLLDSRLDHKGGEEHSLLQPQGDCNLRGDSVSSPG
jgi:hypothetical protein